MGARISGAGIGGRDIAAWIPLPEMGFLSLEYLKFCGTLCFFGFTGVSRDPEVVATSAVRTAPRLVCFAAHATRWNFGEVECSSVRFLAIAEVGKQGL